MALECGLGIERRCVGHYVAGVGLDGREVGAGDDGAKDAV